MKPNIMAINQEETEKLKDIENGVVMGIYQILQ